MHVQVLAKTDQEMRLVVDGLNPQIANSLRQIMMSRLPTLAIETVDFSKNDGVLYDEMLAHRLGLLALKFDTKAFVAKDDCDCEGKGCSGCELVFVLDKQGPGMVYAKDLKSADKELASVVHPDTPLVELRAGQDLKLQATATIGLGTGHARHQAAHAFYRLYPGVKVSGNISNVDDVISSCSKKALNLTGKPSVTIDCDMCGECVEIAKPAGSLKIEGNTSKFVFIIESISGLTAEQIFLQSLDILKKEAKDFGKQVGKLK